MARTSSTNNSFPLFLLRYHRLRLPLSIIPSLPRRLVFFFCDFSFPPLQFNVEAFSELELHIPKDPISQPTQVAQHVASFELDGTQSQDTQKQLSVSSGDEKKQNSSFLLFGITCNLFSILLVCVCLCVVLFRFFLSHHRGQCIRDCRSDQSFSFFFFFRSFRSRQALLSLFPHLSRLDFPRPS